MTETREKPRTRRSADHRPLCHGYWINPVTEVCRRVCDGALKTRAAAESEIDAAGHPGSCSVCTVCAADLASHGLKHRTDR